MRQAAVLFGPTVEVRDVVESFLQDGVRVAGCRQRLSDASRQFVELGHRPDGDPYLIDLGRRIAALVGSELGTSPLTTELATEMANLLDEVRVAGLPQPEDDDWAF